MTKIKIYNYQQQVTLTQLLIIINSDVLSEGKVNTTPKKNHTLQN